MSTFTVSIARLLTKPHNACFLDFAQALVDALRTLGHEVAPPDSPKELRAAWVAEIRERRATR